MLEIADNKFGIIFVQRFTPKTASKIPNPSNIKVTPKDKIDVKKLFTKFINPTKATTNPAKSRAAKRTKTENPKAATHKLTVNSKIPITKIIGNQMGKKIIFKNNSNIILPLSKNDIYRKVFYFFCGFFFKH